MRFTALLFDFDGCVSDAAPAIVESHRSTLEMLGLEIPDDARLRALIGPPLQTGLRVLLPEVGVPLDQVDLVLPEYVHRYRADYSVRSLDRAAAPAGVADAVRRLAESVPLAIATSKPLRYTVPILEALGLRSFFRVVEGPVSDSDPEPKDVTIGRALERMELPPGSGVAMVGDRSHDIAGGRAHDLTTIGVTWGIGDRGELEAAGADAIVDAPGELLSLCGCA